MKTHRVELLQEEVQVGNIHLARDSPAGQSYRHLYQPMCVQGKTQKHGGTKKKKKSMKYDRSHNSQSQFRRLD